MKDFPPLEFKSTRSREFNAHTEEQRAATLYLYLFKGLSFRAIDEKLSLGPTHPSNGWQSHNICHYLGLTSYHKGIFKEETISTVLTFFFNNSDNPDYAIIYYYLSLYFGSNCSLTMIEEIKGKTWIRTTLLSDKPEREYDDALRHVDTTIYKSNAYLKERLKSLYDYRCQVCGDVILRRGWQKGLRRIDEWKYLSNDAHHILPLSKKGEDVKENLICLCPTCHRKFHSGEFRLKVKNGIVLSDELLGRQKDLCYLKHEIII